MTQVATQEQPAASKASIGWLKGPLPAGTWNWGGVVLADGRIVKAEDVAFYNNSLTMPPRS